jgi:hypothetical protein
LNIENEDMGEEQSPAPDCASLIEVEVEHNEQEQEQSQLLKNRRQSIMFYGIEFLELDPPLRQKYRSIQATNKMKCSKHTQN